MKALYLLPFALLISACSSLPSHSGNVDAVLQASGLDSQLQRLATPLPIDDKLEGPLSIIPDDFIALINTTISDNLKPDQIRDELKSSLQQNLKSGELADVQKFYESAIGKRVIEVESQKTTASSGLNDSATLKALADASGAGSAASALAQAGLNDALDMAVKNGCFNLDKIPMAGFVVGAAKKAQLKVLRSSVNDAVRQQYAALSPAEQAGYLAFIQSKAGQKFLSTRTTVMNNAATRVGASLKDPLYQQVKGMCGQ
jgi:hypothetical protein